MDINLRTDRSLIRVNGGRDRYLLARFPAPPSAQARSPPPRPIRPRAEQEVAFLALGPIAEQFLRTAAAAGTSRLQSELAAIVALEAAWGRAALLAALERALQFHRFRADDVRSILMAGAGVATPVPAGESLPMALGLPTVPTRSLDAYALAEVVR